VPLLAGAVVAFVACCVAGRVVSRVNHYEKFARFHPYCHLQTFYYPTASQVLALARQYLSPGRIAVVVGGNSVLAGLGQREQQLWTHQLEQLLGPDYRVLNLAMPAAQPAEFGGVIAEVLAGEFRKLIYITNIGSLANFGEADGLLYRYFFWDAYLKGLLPHTSPRDGLLAYLSRQRAEQGTGFFELKAGRRLDSLLYFQDLWTTCALTKLNTVWPGRTDGTWTRPRAACPNLWERTHWPFNPNLDAGYVGLIRGWAANCVEWVAGGRLEKRVAPGDSLLAQNLLQCFPASVRSRALLVMLSDSPHFLDQLSPEKRADYRWAAEKAAVILEDAGFTALVVGNDFSTEDFIDVVHLSESGGRKLAHKVAPKVRDLAARLGYLEEGRKP
jgi:hypothetical protein